MVRGGIITEKTIQKEIFRDIGRDVEEEYFFLDIDGAAWFQVKAEAYRDLNASEKVSVEYWPNTRLVRRITKG